MSEHERDDDWTAGGMTGSSKLPISDEREQGIRMWWGCMDQGGLDIGDVQERVGGRLRRAFRQVLSKLSEDQFRKFWDLAPQVICLPLSRAKVFNVNGVVIYFAPGVFRLRDERIADVVAHEVARLMLGHQDAPAISNVDAVDAVGDLVKRWGFKRSYSRKDYQACDSAQPSPPPPQAAGTAGARAMKGDRDGRSQRNTGSPVERSRRRSKTSKS